MGKQRIDAWERITVRESSNVKYFFKYTLKEFLAKVFTPTPFPEKLLQTTFDLFVREWSGNNDPVSRIHFNSEDEYEAAEDLYQEIKALIDYWNDRCRKDPRTVTRDRILDDQMLIRLVKIRHKLNFEDF